MRLDPIALSLPSRQLTAIADQLTRQVKEVIDSGWWLKGSQTRLFEEEWAAYCGMPFCLTVANGTDGLELALRAIGAAGREVVTVANAGGYTTTACRLIGAIPSYSDIDADRLVMDVGAALNAVTPKTKAVVATHLYGNVVDVPALQTGLRDMGRADVLVVEDGSQAHGATLGKSKVGSLGDIAVFSFYPTKNLGALGDAGAIVCRDQSTYERLVGLHQYGWTERYRSEVPFGRNSRIDEIQAAVLRVKLPHLDDWNRERRRIGRVYSHALAGTTMRLISDVSDNAVVHLSVIRTGHRDRLQLHLRGLGIATGVHFPVLDPDQISQANLPCRIGDLSQSRNALGEILTVPSFPGMLDEEVERVAVALRSFTEKAV